MLTTIREVERRGAVFTEGPGFLSELTIADPDAAGALAEPQSGEGGLLERLRRGEEEAFAELVRVHGGRLLATARRFLPAEQDAQDAVQEAFLSAFQALGTFRHGSRLSTWLHRIVVNAALMRLRRRRRRPEQSIEELLPRFDPQGAWVQAPVRFEAPGAALERSETREWVRRGIDRLPESCRTALLLRDVEELDTKETADLLGITPNAVKVRLHRARLALRAVLAGAPAGREARNQARTPASHPTFKRSEPARRRAAVALQGVVP